jgi:hypothetical protein
MQVPVAEAVNTVSDLARLLTAVAWGVGAFFLRDVYREFRELRNDVHGKGGINERLARVEGIQEANGTGA